MHLKFLATVVDCGETERQRYLFCHKSATRGAKRGAIALENSHSGLTCHSRQTKNFKVKIKNYFRSLKEIDSGNVMPSHLAFAQERCCCWGLSCSINKYFFGCLWFCVEPKLGQYSTSENVLV